MKLLVLQGWKLFRIFLSQVGTFGTILGAGGLAFLGRKVIKNGGKIIEVTAKVIKKQLREDLLFALTIRSKR